MYEGVREAGEGRGEGNRDVASGEVWPDPARSSGV